MSVTFYTLNFLTVFFLNMLSETTIMDSGFTNCFKLSSKLLDKEIVNIIINFVVRLDK